MSRSLWTLVLLLWASQLSAQTATVIQAYINTTATTAVSASFTINSGDLIVAVYHCDQNTNDVTDSCSLTDNDADLAFTQGPQRGATESGAGYVGLSYYNATRTDTGVVVTITADGLNNDTPYLKIYRVASFDTTTPNGAVNEGNLTADPQAASLTLQTNGMAIVGWTDWNQTGTPTSEDGNPASSLGLTETGFNDVGDISGASGFLETTSGAKTFSMNSGAAPAGNWIAFEVRDGGGAAPAPKRLLTLGAGEP